MDTGCANSFHRSRYNQQLVCAGRSVPSPQGLRPSGLSGLPRCPAHCGRLAWAECPSLLHPKPTAHSPLPGPPVQGSSSSLCPAALGLTTRHCEVLGASPVRPSPTPCFFSQHHASLGAGPRHAQISRAEGMHARLGPSFLPAVSSWPGCPPGRCTGTPSPTGRFLPTSPGPHAHSERIAGRGPRAAGARHLFIS